MRHHRHHRRNPDTGTGQASLMKEGTKTLGATLLGAGAVIAGVYGINKISPTSSFGTAKVKAGLVMGSAALLGLAAHYKGYAPRVGKAVIGAGLGIGGLQMAQAYNLEGRLNALLTPCPTGQTRNAQGVCAAPAAAGLPSGAVYPIPTRAGREVVYNMRGR